jgi:hypothetical protein
LPRAGYRMGRPSSRQIVENRLLKVAWPVLPPRIVREIVLCIFLVAGQAFLFSRKHHIEPWLVFVAIPPGLALGLLRHVLAGPEGLLHAWVSRHLDLVLAGFGLFFFHLVFYILLFSVVVSYPMGLMIGTFWGSMDLARDYMVYSVNLVFILAAGSWLRWWRTIGRPNS